MKRNSLFAFAFAMLLASTGCSYVKTPVLAFSDDGDYLQRDVGPGLVASPNPLIPDVPMPIGFKAVTSQSTWHYDGRVRVVNHVYQGHAKQGDTVAFYQQALPDNHWTLTDIQSVGDATVMNYTKGPERLELNASQGWGITTIKIQIAGR